MIVFVAGDWRAHVVRGVATLLFGIVALIWPDITLWVLVVLFGAFVLVHGISLVAAVVTQAPGTQTDRGWLLLQGGLSIVVGLITVVWPDITGLALLYVIAAWAALTGVMEIVVAIRMRRELSHEWLLIVSGALSLAFAALLVITPGAGALVITWLIAWYAIVYGIMLLMLALRLRKLQTRPPAVAM